MAFEKKDSFTPKRSTNIDGFVGGPIQERPRQPRFRGPSTEGVRHTAPTLGDMPKRGQPQPVLTSMRDVNVTATAAPLPGSERHRRHMHKAVPDGEQRTRRKRRPLSLKKIFKRIGIVLGVLILLGGVWFGLKFYKDIAKLTGDKNPLALLSVFHPVPLKNQGGRVNILVAGNSADDPGHNGANLTDSIMVLSLNTKNNTAFMLSVPRDLWVNIPGVGYQKINDAYPNGGMNMLQQVIQKDLGMTIDYQVLVNYGAFKGLVSAVGGITINIQSSDPRGIYDPNRDYTSKDCCALADYPNGPVTLDGQQALDLARARGDPSPYGVAYGFPDGDFDRTNHQRQMLEAIKDKADKGSVIANPFKVSQIFDAIGNNITTNLKLAEIETLYTYVKKVNDNNIGSYNVNTLAGANTTLLANYTSPSGQDALIPAAGIDDFSDIQTQVRRILSSNPIVREGASVEVLNGTDVTGLAADQVNTLTNQGMTVTVDDAPATQATTTIIDNSLGKMPNSLAYLKKQYNATVVTNASLTSDYPAADFIVIIGQNVATSTSQEQQGN